MKEKSDTENVLGYQITNAASNLCVNQIIKWIKEDGLPRSFVCANPHSMIVAEKDELFQEAIHDSDLVTPDGTGIVLASKILGGSIRQRVTGSDIFEGVCNKLNEIGGMSCFFLGSTEKTLIAIKEKMSEEYPNIVFAGSYSPPYKPEFNEKENRLMINAVNEVNPDVLWVGMTAPKQEKWVYQHKEHLKVKFVGSVGAVFDFYIGQVKRSHPFMQKIGLEWLPRLIQEPCRLFRRNFVSSPLFLYRVYGQRFRKNL